MRAPLNVSSGDPVPHQWQRATNPPGGGQPLSHEVPGHATNAKTHTPFQVASASSPLYHIIPTAEESVQIEP